MANESNKELTSVWTPANIVTCVRIVFIPVFMIVSALSHTSVAGTDWSTFDGPLAAAAFILYVILSCTDKVDGYLARSRNEITDFGKFLDPIADKLLVFSALLLFLDFGAVTVWSVFIILFRELLVSALRMVASAAGVVIAADKLGKYKTATTMVSICGYLCVFAMTGLQLGPAELLLGVYGVSRFLYAVAVVLTVISGAQYFWNCRKIVFSVQVLVGMADSFEQISAHNEELARDIVERASARGVTVSTAESLTAGMIASTIADIPGASAVLRGGAVTYCDEIKHRVLGVEQETLDRFSAVSHQTAREMAAGSLDLYQSDVAVSATGYAGPGGGTEQDPAGTFYIGWAYRVADGEVPIVDSVRCHYEGDRSCVRAHAVTEALGRIALVLNSME